MAYTIVKSDGTVLTTIPDGTINTSSTSLGLPGRNYAGYGAVLDTNYVHTIENFANNAPPANPLRGQLWYNTNNNTLNVCPTDGETNAAAWLSLATTSSGGNTTFGNAIINGTIQAGYGNVTNDLTVGGTLTTQYLTVSTSATLANATLTGTTQIANTVTTVITTGGASTAGTMTGTWTYVGGGTAGGYAGTTSYITGGNLVISNVAGGGLKIDPNCLYDLSGNVISFTGTYSNSNVASYMPVYNGAILASSLRTANITTGANTTAGTLTGNWTLTTGSRLQATYADLAERFAADDIYEPGTVVELGGKQEITAVKFELSEDVFGVISNTAAYLMNAGAGSDATHPPVAVSGRVEVKTIGQVRKGQRLVSAGNGFARAALSGEATAFNTIGRALTDKLSDGEGVVEAIVMIR